MIIVSNAYAGVTPGLLSSVLRAQQTRANVCVDQTMRTRPGIVNGRSGENTCKKK